MLLMGDEMRRTQQGNNNAYCQDTEINWLDWSLLERHARHPPVREGAHRVPPAPRRRRRRRRVQPQPDPRPGARRMARRRAQSAGLERSLARDRVHHAERAGAVSLLHGMFNAAREPLTFEVPPASDDEERWRCCLDTAAAPPGDTRAVGQRPGRRRAHPAGRGAIDRPAGASAAARQSRRARMNPPSDARRVGRPPEVESRPVANTLSMKDAAPTADAPQPLSPDEVALLDAYWRACNYLSVGMIYLQGQPAAAGAADDRARQAPAARPLGREPGALVRLGAPEPADRRARSRRDLRRRPRPRRARRARAGLSRGHLLRGLSGQERGRGRAAASSSSSSPSRATSAATSRRRRPDRSTKAASSATACRTPTAWRSTTPI